MAARVVAQTSGPNTDGVYRHNRTDGSVPTTKIHSSVLSTRSSYKPIAIKLPFLILFASSLFGICIGLIEHLLLSTSSRQSSPNVFNHISKKWRLGCNDAEYSSQLSSLNYQSSSLCGQFSQPYLSSLTNLSIPLQTSFSQWQQEYDSITDAQLELQTRASWTVWASV